MKHASVLTLLLWAAPLFAAGPTIDIPSEIRATGDYVTFTPKTDAKAISYVAQSGVDAFPSDFLRDPRSFVLPVRGLAAGRYNFVAVGTLNDEQTKQAFTVVVGDVPPTPAPGPGPTPPTPGPDPFGTTAGGGLRCLIVYESSELSKLPAPQLTALTAGAVREYLNAKCAVGPDGRTKEWRVWDADVNTAAESAVWQKVMARKRGKLPWVIVSNGTAWYEGPMPGTTDELIALLKRFGG